MIRYNLGAHKRKGKGGRTVELAPIQESPGDEAAYLAACRSMLRALRKACREDALLQVQQQAMLRRADGPVLDDAGPFDLLRRLSESLARVAAETVDRVLGLAAKRHTKAFMASARRAIGVDLGAVLSEGDLGQQMALISQRNAALIRDIGDEAVKRIVQIVTQAALNGTALKTVSKQITEAFQVSDRRAQRIARDQIAKFNSDLNRIRHQQAGITTYKWLTARDERVRPLHRALHGKIYAYGEATGAEDGLPPGQPYACRCVAMAIVEF